MKKLIFIVFIFLCNLHGIGQIGDLNEPPDTITDCLHDGMKDLSDNGIYYDCYNDYADALFLRITSELTPSRKQIISNTINKYVYFGLWNKTDARYMPAYTQQAATLNWIRDSFNLSLTGDIEFRQDTGFKGNGTNTHISTNYNPNDDNIHFSKSFSNITFYKYEDELDVALSMGCRNSVSGYSTNLTCGDLSGRMIARIDGNQIVTTGLGANGGWYATAARPSNHFTFYNGVLIDTDSEPSYLDYESLDFYLLAYNLNGAISSRASHTMSIASIGGYYTQKEIMADYNISIGYLYDIGSLTKEDSVSIYCEGNSLTVGTVNNPGKSYPTLVSDSNSTWKVTNAGGNGDELTNILSTLFSDGNALKSYDITNKNEIIIIWAGTNDIYKDSSAVATHDLLDSLCTELQMWGYKVIVMTTLPTTRLSVTSQDVSGVISEYNALIRANYSNYADGIVSLDLDSRLDDPMDTNYYASDELHLIEAGYSIVQELSQPVIENLLE